MTNSSLNISGKIDPATVEVLDDISCLCGELNIPFVVVGATARDLVMHHGHGLPLPRATRDVDFAVEVPDWAAFDTLKVELAARGYVARPERHRMVSPKDIEVDVLPFGGVSGSSTTVRWRPDHDVRMNVCGFKEACAHPEWVRIREGPDLDIPVATPAGLVLLKIVAWMERPREVRGKDARDVGYLLESYERIPAVRDALYDRNDVMERYHWDALLAGACCLGEHALALAEHETRELILALLTEAQRSPSKTELVEEMCTNVTVQYGRKLEVLQAFLDGFTA